MRRHVGLWQLFRFVCLPLLLIGVFLVIQPVAEAQVTLIGSWDIRGKGKVCVKKLGCETIDLLEACFDASDDGSINWFEEGDTFSGTWTQKGKKFLIKLDEDEIVALFESLCEEFGVSCDVIDSTAFLKGKVNKQNDSIRGKLRMSGTLIIEERSFKFSFKGSFTGTRTEGCTTDFESTPFSTLQDTSNSMLTNLAQRIFFSSIR